MRYLPLREGRHLCWWRQLRTVVVEEFPVGAVLEYARGHEVDLIALATHGRSGVARWLLGGVADKVVRGATLPVLVTTFTRVYGMSPSAYRAAAPPASAHAIVPSCVVRVYGRPRNRTFREDTATG